MKLNELYTAELHDEGSDLQILDGQKKATKLILKLKGADSKAVRLHNKRQQKAYFECIRKDQDFDDEKWLIEGLVEATISWRGVTDVFSKKLCKDLYENAPYVKEQADEFIAERVNFTKAKPKR